MRNFLLTICPLEKVIKDSSCKDHFEDYLDQEEFDFIENEILPLVKEINSNENFHNDGFEKIEVFVDEAANHYFIAFYNDIEDNFVEVYNNLVELEERLEDLLSTYK